MSSIDCPTAEEVLKRCNKKVLSDDVDDILDEIDDDRDRAVMKRYTDDIKGVLGNFATQNDSSQVGRLSNTFTQFLNQSVSTRRLVTPAASVELCKNLDVFINATRHTVSSVDGAVTLDPFHVGTVMKEKLRERLDLYEAEVENHCVVNPLLEEDVVDTGVGFGETIRKLATSFTVLADVARYNSHNIFQKDKEESVLFSKVLQPATNERAQTLEFMLPLLNSKNVEKEKKAVKRKKDDTTEAVVVSDKTNAVISSDDVPITNKLDHIRRCLKETLKKEKSQRINFYEFVYDPTEFLTVVHNIFHTSYLVRDKKVFLVFVDGIPYIYTDRNLVAQLGMDVAVENVCQGILSLDYNEYMRLRKIFKDKKPCIVPMVS